MKVVIELTDKEIQKLDEQIGIQDKEYEDDVADAIHTLLEVI